MTGLLLTLLMGLLTVGCGGSKSVASGSAVSAAGNDSGTMTSSHGRIAGQDDFGTREGDASGGGANGSKLVPTATEAVLKLIVQSENKQPVPNVVVKAVADSGEKIYTPETDAMGYTEIMVPIGTRFTLTYLSLFQDEVEKQTEIPNEPGISMKLTLTYIPLKSTPIPGPDEGKLVEERDYDEPVLILEGVEFDTAKAILRPESYEFLDPVLEYLTYKPSAMIELSGHTDNQGNAKKNLKLSEDRANAVRDYLVSKGVDGNRIIAVGYGQEQPIASNDTEEGRQMNRRTEAKEIGK